ncbi:DUF4845 domain-containing protein [Allochromatium vinosum]|uniref:DUF4845 domain-containing protein n=1 Tax=Allochromatium vinosum (strain ATCC 17899 / DSM 180 / NBRC 103801 / NCIMB 10441 / D) TaxID=572477 RepID=D3RTZ2_ALLVD|nr:DUF4845 domain-containing protein [Allochromatium vinosum]ADC62651.1 hypothetical protein Alvin_1719 [Allochromatium vinosum DSM 180]
MSMTTGLAKRQRGAGFLLLIVLIGLASFFGTIALKVGPLYLNFWTVRSIMEETAQQLDPTQEGGVRGIVTSIEKRLYINSIENIKGSDFEVERIDGERFQVSLAYEERVHLFFNVDAVVSFSHQIEVGPE